MSKEESTLIVDLIDLAKRAGCTITITKNGSVIREVCPAQPFTVKDSEVHIDTAKLDDAREHTIEAAETFRNAFKNYRDVVASESTRNSDNLKVDVESIKVEGALTPDDVAQAYLETIGETTGPSSAAAININTLNINVG